MGERERDGATRRTTAPPRYKRTRQEQIDFEKLENRNFGVPERPAPPKGEGAPHDEPEAEIVDPLDAQAMGLHDEAAELGHEEIHLDLGDEEPAPVPEPKPIP